MQKIVTSTNKESATEYFWDKKSKKIITKVEDYIDPFDRKHYQKEISIEEIRLNRESYPKDLVNFIDKLDLFENLKSLEKSLPRKDLYGEKVWDYSNSDLKIVAWCIVENEFGELLILKRSDKVDSPNKWSLLAGTFDEVVQPEELIQKEIKEEIGLKVKLDEIFLKEIISISHEKSKYQIAICKTFTNKHSEIVLNDENDEYNWVKSENIPILKQNVPFSSLRSQTELCFKSAYASSKTHDLSVISF